MNKILFAWIGKTDLRASQEEPDIGLGPICQAVTKRSFSHIILLSNYNKEEENQLYQMAQREIISNN